MKKLLLLAILAFVGCDKEDCATQLQELIDKRNVAFKACNGSFPCMERIQAEYVKRESELLKNCE